jgi:hypothetical protein
VCLAINACIHRRQRFAPHYVKALKLWHPDKFSQNFGSLLCANDSEKILARVKAVSQSIIELRQVYN